MRRLVLAAAALAVAAAVLLLATLPPPPRDLSQLPPDVPLARRTMRGVYHVHTTRSDGAGTKADVAAAAARAGLSFVILTDHGDGTRVPDPPEYIDGVLCIDAVEISTSRGHYAALAMGAAPYPLGGDASAVVEDVHRLGGFGIAAHPDHSRQELAWTAWDTPIDGLEWMNADAEWRDESAISLGRVLFDYLFRPAPALALVFDRPVQTLSRWDSLARTRAVVGLAAVDAHGGRGRSAEAGERAPIAGPSYESSFRSLSNRVLLDRAPSGDASRDAADVLEMIRRGRVYSVVDGLAGGAFLEWLDGLGFQPPAGLPDGSSVERIESGERTRLEIYLPSSPGTPPVPWIVTNWSEAAASFPETPAVRPGAHPLPRSSEWRVEKDPRSTGVLTVDDRSVSLQFRLHDEGRTSQFVAAVADLEAGERFEALTFRASASRPMRVSVQLRFRPDDHRWTRSVYLDGETRDLAIRPADLVPADQPGAPLPDLTAARSLLFVFDLVNAKPGDAGTFTISDLRVAR